MKRLYKFLLGLPVIFALCACPPGREAPSPRPEPMTDTEWCVPMCAHLAELKCPEAEPVYDNDLKTTVTCAEWCQGLQINGSFLNPRCISRVLTCDQIESARQKDPQKECR